MRSVQAHSSAAGTAGEDGPGEEPLSPSGDGGGSASAASIKLPPGQVDFSKRQLVMMFTCTKCETRAAKAFSKSAYTSGVVIVECPGCDARHLVADHLGWFGAKGETIEEFAAERGGAVVSRLADNTLELTPAEVCGIGAVGDNGLREQESKHV